MIFFVYMTRVRICACTIGIHIHALHLFHARMNTRAIYCILILSIFVHKYFGHLLPNDTLKLSGSSTR